MLLLAPAFVILATASDALAHDHSGPAASHAAPAASHGASAASHRVHADSHTGHAVARIAHAGARLVVDTDVVVEDDGSPQAEWTEMDDPGAEPMVAVDTAPRPIPPHLPASAADHRVERHIAFDLGGAYGALAGVDLGTCKAAGLGAGYGKVTLAFDPDGRTAGVGIELPAGSSPGAAACVEQAYGAVTVAPFDGSPVSVSRAFFVEA